jgi:hypothetical protein
MDSRIPGQVGAPLQGDAQLAFATSHDAGVVALEELGVHDVNEKQTHAQTEGFDSKGYDEGEVRYVPTDEETLGIGKGMTAAQKVDNMEEIALYALHVEDDPTLNPWTVSQNTITIVRPPLLVVWPVVTVPFFLNFASRC